MSSRRIVVSAFLLVLSILASGCASGSVKSLADVNRLQQSLVKKFEEQEINVHLNNSTELVVTFINSPLVKASVELRNKRAAETASFVKESYPEMNSISVIVVGFVKQQTRYLVMTQTEALEYFSFDRNAKLLEPESPRAPPPDTVSKFDPLVSHFEIDNLTDISLHPLELLSTERDKVTLAPHYTVAGYITFQTKSAAPTFVTLDFLYLSSRDLMPGNTTIELFTDDKSIFRTPANYEQAVTADTRGPCR